MATKRSDEWEVSRSEDKTYNFTSTTFIKREIPLHERRHYHGKPVTNLFFPERFQNEAAALQLIRDHTSIPVPELKGWGRDENGLLYLETVVPGVRADMAGDECRMPTLHYTYGSYTGGVCDQCKELARQNCNRFVNTTLRPQLKSLTSLSTGLKGIVIPPTWMLNMDERSSWEPKHSTNTTYYMTHGDMFLYNLMLSLETLEVVAAIDWEHSGFFSLEFQQWCDTKEKRALLCHDERFIRNLVAMIEP